MPARPGAGRPKGSKDSRPRIRKSEILDSRRAQWDKWEQQTGALARARKVLLQIMEDEEASNRDRLRAIQMLEDRGMGAVRTETEQPVAQPLMIFLPREDGGFARYEDVARMLEDGNTVEGEIVDAGAPSYTEAGGVLHQLDDR